MHTKPAIPKGTRDFLSNQMIKRSYIFDTVRGVFEKYGYQPIETPAMENTATLLGKYGEEGDRLIFKILKRGASLEKALAKVKDQQNDVSLAEEALRYDLTVPFARFVVQHQNDIVFPFKRYQIQPVWRADRPQKGRYREFFQCDVDVIGSSSLLNEVELIQIVDEVFTNLGINVTIKLNNRKILAGIAELIGESERLIDITIALDKLDKIGADGVEKELRQNGFSDATIEQLRPIIDFRGTNEEKLVKLKQLIGSVEIGQKGIDEVAAILEMVDNLGLDQSKLSLDITLARGLNYYTGAIFEVVSDAFPSSICGGGRYDDLTGIFGLKDVSGVGVSFGADRIYDLMNDMDLFPPSTLQSLDILFVNFGNAEAAYCLQQIKSLRSKGVKCELYPEPAKMKKQMKYANERGVRKVVMVGTKEMESHLLTVKDMGSGVQKEMNLEELINSI